MRISVFIFALLIWGCGASVTQEEDLPEDLASLKSLQRETKDEIKQLEDQLDLIEERILEVDPSVERPRRLVTTMILERSDFHRYAKIQGSVESENTVSVSSEVGGKITMLTVDEGDAVRRGQLIAKIDLESLRKQRAELETSLELARDIYERQKRLWDQEIGSEVQYLQAKNNVERLEKSIETIEYQLTKENLYAPLSGVVDMVNLKSGETASPGMPIIMILDTRNVKVTADVPENYLGKVSRGEMVDIRFPALDEELTAKVTLVGSKIDPTNRTFEIEIDIPYNQGLYKPNLLAEVLINDYTEEDVLVVSQELVQEEVGGKDYVMVVEERDEELVSKRAHVETGESYEGNVIIISGIEEGAQLIVEGARGLAPGERIKIVEPEVANTDDE